MVRMSTLARGYRKYLLPAVVFQSVLIGGGYATGREIVEYAGKFGAIGVWSILAIFVGFAVISAIAYEFARIFRTYNYRAFMRRLLGPFWLLFDVLFIVMAIIIIAVLGSAAGAIGESVIGLPAVAGLGIVIALVAVLNFFGRGLIEGFKSFGTIVLYAGFIVFAVVVLARRWGHAQEVLITGQSSFVESATIGAAFGSGILYVGYNLAVLPAVFFTLDRQSERRETMWSGLLTGVLATIPFVLTYLCVLAFYPREDVLGAPIPWLAMLQAVGGAALSAAFVVVVMYTLIETVTGLSHAILDRIQDALAETGRRPLTGMQRAVFSVIVLVAAALLSQVGIIALVAQGYTAMAYGFLIVFALPLVTYGIYKIITHRAEADVPMPEGSQKS